MRLLRSALSGFWRATCVGGLNAVVAAVGLSILVGFAAAPAAAQTTNLSGTSRSTFDNNGSVYGDGDGFIQWGTQAGFGFRGVITFNVPAGSPSITAAEVRVPGSSNVANSPATELRNVSTPFTYAAVGSGALIGGPTAVIRTSTTPIQLNAAGVSALNALAAAGGGTLNIGFKIETENLSREEVYYTGLSASSFSLVITRPTLTISPTSLPSAQVGQAFSQSISASGGTAPYSFAVTTGALPAGMTLSSSGSLSGTPTAGGSFNFTVQATDGQSVTGSRSYSLTVQSPTISLPFQADPFKAVVNQPFRASIPTPTGGTAPYSYALVSGTLPDGITLSSAGVLSGTPTTAGFSNLTIRATDSSTGTGPYNAIQSYSLLVDPGVVLGTAEPSFATAGQTYSHTFTVTGGMAPYSFAVTAGSLPAGVMLSSSGALSGTPTATGSFSFTVTATDGQNMMGSRAYSLSVRGPSINLPGTEPFMAVVNQPFRASVPAASGGTAPYSYALVSGTLPDGISLSSDGILSGTPRTAGSFDVGIQATDSTTGTGPFNSAGQEYAFVVDPGVPVAEASSVSLPFGTASMTVPLTLSGGAATAVSITTPPTRGTATVSGTSISYQFTEAGYVGSDSFAYTASNANGTSEPTTVTVTRAAPTVVLAGGAQPEARVGVAYSQTLSATGGTAPYTYAVTGGALPAGVTLSSAGLLSGTPTAGGAFSFTVTATDSSTGTGPFRVAAAHSLTVAGASVTVSGAALPAGSRGTPYSQAVTATGGVAPYSYAVSSGTLPAGLTLSSSGQISGTPTAVGTFAFQVRATDSATGEGPYSGTANLSVTINAATVTVTPAVLADALEGVAFSQQFQASGGQGSYSFALTAGSLPAGLILSPGGLLRGTPNTAGTFAFTVTATDGFGNTGAAAIRVTVTSRPDPAADPDVRGLNTAQAEATRRLVGTQLQTFGRRLEQLHRGGEAQARTSLNLTLDGSAFAPLDAGRRTMGELSQFLDLQEGRDRQTAERDALTRMVWGDRAQAGTGNAAGTADARRTAADTGTGGADAVSGPRVWVGGSISLGERDATTRTAELSITTSGISAGVDVSLSDALDLGVGVGYGREDTDVGSDSSRMESYTRLAVAYGSWRPMADVFVDGMLGYAQLDFTTRRRTPVDRSLVSGERDGSARFGSLSAGLDRVAGAARWIGYGRVEVMNADLDAYVEAGSPLWALRYEARDLESLQGAVGLRYEREILRGEDVWTPGVRVEWAREFGDAGPQALRYADFLNGPGFLIGQEGWERSSLNLGLTLGWRSGGGWSLSADYDGAFSDGQSLHGLRARMSKAF